MKIYCKRIHHFTKLNRLGWQKLHATINQRNRTKNAFKKRHNFTWFCVRSCPEKTLNLEFVIDFGLQKSCKIFSFVNWYVIELLFKAQTISVIGELNTIVDLLRSDFFEIYIYTSICLHTMFRSVE